MDNNNKFFNDGLNEIPKETFSNNNDFMSIFTKTQISNDVNNQIDTITINQNNISQQNTNVINSNSNIQNNSVNSIPQSNTNLINDNSNVQNNNSFINTITYPQINNENSTMQNNFQSNNINSIQQQNIGFTNNTQINDEELLKAFIGANYEKISTRKFNFAGFFFTTLYMFYRKMILYAILIFLVNIVVLNVVNNFIVTLLFNIVIGFFVNKVYLSYANKKISKIKFHNSQKSINELKEICLIKGGTSIGKIFLGIFAELGITFVIVMIMFVVGIGSFIGNLLNINGWNITSINNENDSNNSSSLKEDISFDGIICSDSDCSISIIDGDTTVEYAYNADDLEFFRTLADYSTYVKVNIHYTQNEQQKTIVDYDIFLRKNNENISDIKSEEELRKKIGLYLLGTHTVSLTLSKIGASGAGFKNNQAYTYTNYTFTDNKNNKYDMKYINSNGALKLVVGNKYIVTFEVVKGILGYEFNMKSIK